MAPINQANTHSEDDCGSYSTRPAATTGNTTPANSSNNKSGDPFLYYSSDEVRMNALKLNPHPGRNVPEQEPKTEVERKTRLSFELHPNLLLEDILLDDLDGDGNAIDTFDSQQPLGSGELAMLLRKIL